MLLSDNVLITLITTLGTVVGSLIPTLAVVVSRQSTKRQINGVHDDVKDVKETAQRNSGSHPTPAIPDTETPLNAHDDGRRAVEH